MSPLLSAAELASRLQEDGLVVLDCRYTLDAPAWGETAYGLGHIPGARYAHLERDLSSPSVPGRSGRHPLPEPEALCARLRAWGVSRTGTVVVYDQDNSAHAARAWWLLRWLGHEAVRVLDGGWQAWRDAGGAASQDSPDVLPGDFTGTADASRCVDAGELLARLQAPDLALLDARALPRFRGEVEPIDPVAGHIPGAVCAAFTENLQADGRFLPAEALRARFARLCQGRAQTVCYCGSGVTACHNILAHAIAGLADPRLYPGSWSEWITDPSRPIARDGHA